MIVIYYFMYYFSGSPVLFLYILSYLFAFEIYAALWNQTQNVLLFQFFMISYYSFLVLSVTKVTT